MHESQFPQLGRVRCESLVIQLKSGDAASLAPYEVPHNYTVAGMIMNAKKKHCCWRQKRTLGCDPQRPRVEAGCCYADALRRRPIRVTANLHQVCWCCSATCKALTPVDLLLLAAIDTLAQCNPPGCRACSLRSSELTHICPRKHVSSCPCMFDAAGCLA